jgi:hypothetical protein
VKQREFATVREVEALTRGAYSAVLLASYSRMHDLPTSRVYCDAYSYPAFHKDAWRGLYGVRI